MPGKGEMGCKFDSKIYCKAILLSGFQPFGGMGGYHTQGCPDLQPGCPGLTSDGTFSPSALSELIKSGLQISNIRQEYILSAIMIENYAE
jgi:hypothetical protein